MPFFLVCTHSKRSGIIFVEFFFVSFLLVWSVSLMWFWAIVVAAVAVYHGVISTIVCAVVVVAVVIIYTGFDIHFP